MDLPTVSECTDKQLLKAYTSRRDESAFAELVKRHSAMAKRLCWRILGNEQDADDAVQAVFMVLARRAKLVAWQSSIANWLYGAAWRIAHREVRRRGKLRRQDYDMNTHPESPAVERELETFEGQLYPLINQLPTRYRTAIIHCYLEGMPRKEAATELGISESVLKGRLERARELLRKQLTTADDQEITQLTSGALVALISQSRLSGQQIQNLAQSSIGYAAGVSSSTVSALSIRLANGDSQMLLAAFQLKTALFACGIAGALGGLGWAVNEFLATAPVAAAATIVADAPIDQQKDLATKRHLTAIVYAMHLYADNHEGKLPPAAVPNSNLPIEKRLSGFVLLLPYLGLRPEYINENDPEWKAWHADNARARAIHAKIDLTKAWDDPANAEAAKSIVPEFLCPLESTTQDAQGRGLSHFAMVRGGLNRDNGMFPLAGNQDLAIPDINDGTSQTVAVGQIHDKPGPWIAAGSSTARFFNPISDKTQAGFGSSQAGLAYFANGDSTTYCLDLASTSTTEIDALSGRDDRKLFDMDSLKQYPTMTEALMKTKK